MSDREEKASAMSDHEEEVDFISALPVELIRRIFSYLKPKDIAALAQVNKLWNDLASDDVLWKSICRDSQITNYIELDDASADNVSSTEIRFDSWKAIYFYEHDLDYNWRTKTLPSPMIVNSHEFQKIIGLVVSDTFVLTALSDRSLRVYSTSTGECLSVLRGHTLRISSMLMQNKTIISGSHDATIRVWDAETGICEHEMMGHLSTILSLSSFKDKCASGSMDNTVRLWNLKNGTCLNVLQGHSGFVSCVQYNGSYIISGSHDTSVRVWNADTIECIHTLLGHTRRINALKIKDVRLISLAHDMTVRIWNIESGNCENILEGHTSFITAMDLRGNILVTAGSDSSVKVWNITTGICGMTIKGPYMHRSVITSVQFNHKFIITSSLDGTIKLWDVETGSFIRNLAVLTTKPKIRNMASTPTKLIFYTGSYAYIMPSKLGFMNFDVAPRSSVRLSKPQ